MSAFANFLRSPLALWLACKDVQNLICQFSSVPPVKTDRDMNRNCPVGSQFCYYHDTGCFFTPPPPPPLKMSLDCNFIKIDHR